MRAQEYLLCIQLLANRDGFVTVHHNSKIGDTFSVVRGRIVSAGDTCKYEALEKFSASSLGTLKMVCKILTGT